MKRLRKKVENYKALRLYLRGYEEGAGDMSGLEANTSILRLAWRLWTLLPCGHEKTLMRTSHLLCNFWKYMLQEPKSSENRGLQRQMAEEEKGY